MQVRIDVVQSDITGLAVEAIVNAANPGLLGGGGVDGAIHRAAGPGLMAECRALPQSSPGVRCPTGEARITGGHGLRVGHVIHTVGPVWRDGTHGEPAQLAACYRNSLELAERHGLASIAFPAISCGIYGYPLHEAVEVAVREVRDWLAEHDTPRRVVFCCFSSDAAAAYRAALSL